MYVSVGVATYAKACACMFHINMYAYVDRYA